MKRNDRAWVATRKGLFELRRGANTWAIERVSFLADLENLDIELAAPAARIIVNDDALLNIAATSAFRPGSNWRFTQSSLPARWQNASQNFGSSAPTARLAVSSP